VTDQLIVGWLFRQAKRCFSFSRPSDGSADCWSVVPGRPSNQLADCCFGRTSDGLDNCWFVVPADKPNVFCDATMPLL